MKGKAKPKGIDLIDEQLLESLKDAHRRIHNEIEGESELGRSFVNSFEHIRDEVDPDSVRTQARALLNLWVEQSKENPASGVGDRGSYSDSGGIY
jgi:hypothetical protein